MLTFQKFSEINSKRNQEVFPKLGWTESHWSNAIAGETGELCNMIKKRSRYELYEYKKESDNISIEELGKELADIVCYADLLATELGLNLENCIKQKFNEVSDRYGCDIKL